MEEDFNIDQRLEKLIYGGQFENYLFSFSKWKFSSRSITFGEDLCYPNEEAQFWELKYCPLPLREALDPLEVQVLKLIEKAEEADCLVSKYEYVREAKKWFIQERKKHA